MNYFSAERSRGTSRHPAASPSQAPVTRRGKKSDDSEMGHHLQHQHTSDDQVEDIIFQQRDEASSSGAAHSTFNADLDNDNFSKHKSQSKLRNKETSMGLKRGGKKFSKHLSSHTVNKIHNTQGKVAVLSIRHQVITSLRDSVYFTKESIRG